MTRGDALPGSEWDELSDHLPGRLPRIRAVEESIVYELRMVPTQLADRQQFRPTPRTRLVLRCDDAETIFARIVEVRRG